MTTGDRNTLSSLFCTRIYFPFTPSLGNKAASSALTPVVTTLSQASFLSPSLYGTDPKQLCQELVGVGKPKTDSLCPPPFPLTPHVTDWGLA